MFRSLISGAEVNIAEGGFSDRSITACISGHRDIPADRDMPCSTASAKLLIEHYIDCAVREGYRVFISGLAEGTDLWAADYIVRISGAVRDIKLVGVMPCLRHAERFSQESRRCLARAERAAFRLYTTCDEANAVYSAKQAKYRDIYRSRNYFMVDNSSALLGFYDPGLRSRSGTGQTVRYAQKKHLDIHTYDCTDIFGIESMSGGDRAEAGRILSESRYFRYL